MKVTVGIIAVAEILSAVAQASSNLQSYRDTFNDVMCLLWFRTHGSKTTEHNNRSSAKSYILLYLYEYVSATGRNYTKIGKNRC